jgi:hypothetical protein
LLGRQYTEQTNRGITIRFQPSGRVWLFDWGAFFDIIVKIVVLVPLATVAIVFFAVNLHPRRRFYNKFIYEKLDFGREMSNFAATAAMVVSHFQRWDKGLGNIGGGSGGSGAVLTRAELAAVFSPTIEEKRANQLAGMILARGDMDHDGHITSVEMINILTRTMYDWDDLLQMLDDEEGRSKKKKRPEAWAAWAADSSGKKKEKGTRPRNARPSIRHRVQRGAGAGAVQTGRSNRAPPDGMGLQLVQHSEDGMPLPPGVTEREWEMQREWHGAMSPARSPTGSRTGRRQETGNRSTARMLMQHGLDPTSASPPRDTDVLARTAAASMRKRLQQKFGVGASSGETNARGAGSGGRSRTPIPFSPNEGNGEVGWKGGEGEGEGEGDGAATGVKLRGNLDFSAHPSTDTDTDTNVPPWSAPAPMSPPTRGAPSPAARRY